MSTPAVSAYLDAVTGALPAGRRARAAIRAELADGLHCAIGARTRRGDHPDRAAAAAIAEFGPPHVIAHAFARELLLESAHRIGLGLLCGGPLVGVLWVLAAPATAGEHWSGRLHAALTAAPVYPLLMVLVIPAAVAALVAAGRHAGPRLQRLGGPAALLAAIGCVAGDLVLLLTAALTVTVAWPVLLAGAASAARLTVAALAGRRIARLRAAGH